MDIKYSEREETTHPGLQLPKKINIHLVTHRQNGDSQPFSPLELITLYPGENSVPTKRQKTGDKAEKERNTVDRGLLHIDNNSIRVNHNSIRVNDLIFVC